MAKKIYDIVPPKARKKVEKTSEHIESEAEAPVRSVRRRKKESVISWKKWAFASAAGIAAILLVYFYLGLQRATVQIWPKTEIASYSEDVKVDKAAAEIDPEAKIIPGFAVSEEGELTQEFQATGNASNEGKAKGIIKVYNKYSPAMPISLKIGTHFLSDSGKYFVTLSKINIPAATAKGGKTVPGSVEVQVEAEEGGEQYNIGPAKFSVPKLAGTAYYYNIYAESTAAMTGGYAAAVKKVTDDDLSRAQDILFKKLSDDLLAKLKSKNSPDYIYLDEAISKKIIDSSSPVKRLTVIEKFNYTVKAKISAVVFKKSDMEKFSRDYILAQLDDSQKFLEGSLQIKEQVDTADISGGKIGLAVDFSGKIYPTIDKIGLVSQITRKQKNQIIGDIQQTLGDKITNAKVDFYPFWTRKAPKNPNKIKVDLKFE